MISLMVTYSNVIGSYMIKYDLRLINIQIIYKYYLFNQNNKKYLRELWHFTQKTHGVRFQVTFIIIVVQSNSSYIQLLCKIIVQLCLLHMKGITKNQKLSKAPSTISLKNRNYSKAHQQNIQQLPKHRLKTSQSFCIQKNNLVLTPKHAIQLDPIQQFDVKAKLGTSKKLYEKNFFQPMCKQRNGQKKAKLKIQLNNKIQTPKSSRINKKELLNGLKNQMTKNSAIKQPTMNKFTIDQLKHKINNPQKLKVQSGFIIQKDGIIQAPKSMKTSLLIQINSPRFSNNSQKANSPVSKKFSLGIMQKSTFFQRQASQSNENVFPILEKNKFREQQTNYVKNQKYSMKSVTNKSIGIEQPYEFKFEKHLKKQRHYSDASDHSNQFIQTLPYFESANLQNSLIANFQSQSGVSQMKTVPNKISLKSGNLIKPLLHSPFGQMKKSVCFQYQSESRKQHCIKMGLQRVESNPNLRPIQKFFPKKSFVYEQSTPQFIQPKKTQIKLKTQPEYLSLRQQAAVKPIKKQKILLSNKVVTPKNKPLPKLQNKQITLKPKAECKIQLSKNMLQAEKKNIIKSSAAKKLEKLVNKKQVEKFQSQPITQNIEHWKFNTPKSSQQNSLIETTAQTKGKISVSNKKELMFKNMLSKPSKGDQKQGFQYNAYLTPQVSSKNYKKCFQQNINMKLSLTIIQQREHNSQNLQPSTDRLKGQANYQKNCNIKSIFAKKNQAFVSNALEKPKTRKYSQPIVNLKPQIPIKLKFIQEQKCQKHQSAKNKSLQTQANFHIKMPIKVSDFVRGPQIGRGKFGVVNIVRHRKTGCIFALKSIKKKVVNEEKIVQQIVRQIKIQYCLNHPNLVKLYGIFDDKDFLYLLLEFCPDGQLYKILQNKKKFSEVDSCFIMKELCDGVAQLHKNNVIHRDIKPENVVISFGISKICDFGWSIQNNGDLRQTLCGTPLYFSPQLLTKGTYDQKADLWALGIMAFQMLTGRIPFDINSTSELMKIAKSQIHYPSSMNIVTRDFVGTLLQRNPQMRVSISDILKHKFFDIFQSQGQIGRSKSAVRLTTKV